MREQKIVKSTEICSLSMVRRVAAMLDLETATFSEGDILPKGWHFFMLAGETRKSELRADGFPGLGVPIPDLDRAAFRLPRLLLGGRTVNYTGEIVIGSVVEKKSFIKSITEKNANSGRMAIVIIQHELRPISQENPAIIETQTYILKEIRNEELAGVAFDIRKDEITKDSLTKFLIPNSQNPNYSITPDETLLFQYSALGFNSHKIHLDRNYAQNVENLPDLVVNGGLATLLLTEFVRNELKLNLTEIKVKHVAPLYCNRPLTIVFEANELKIYNENNEIAVIYEIRFTNDD